MLSMVTITAAGAGQVYAIGSFFKTYSVANTLALMLIIAEMVHTCARMCVLWSSTAKRVYPSDAPIPLFTN